MKKLDKDSLVEATLLALQGKLLLEESVEKVEEEKIVEEVEEIKEEPTPEVEVPEEVETAEIEVEEDVEEPELETKEDAVEFLKDDEEEAVEGYEKVIAKLGDFDLSEEEIAKFTDVLNHIADEEKEHIEEIETLTEPEVEANVEELPTEEVEEVVEESKEVKTEGIDVSIEGNTTVVDTDEATIIVAEPEEVVDAVIAPAEEVPAEEPVTEIDVVEEVPAEEEIAEPEEVVEESKEVKTEAFDTADKLADGVQAAGGLYQFIYDQWNNLDEDMKREIVLNAVYELNDDAKILADIKERVTEGKECDSEECADDTVVEEDEDAFLNETFDKSITDYLKETNSRVESFKTTKIESVEKGLKIEGTLTKVNGLSKSICLEMEEYRKGKLYAKYTLHEAKGIIVENKQDTKKFTITTFLNENKKVECK